MANAVFGERTKEGSAWAHAQNDLIEEGRGAEVIKAPGDLPAARTVVTRELIDALKTYLPIAGFASDNLLGRERELPHDRRAPERPGHALGGARCRGHGDPARRLLQRRLGSQEPGDSRRRGLIHFREPHPALGTHFDRDACLN